MKKHGNWVKKSISSLFEIGIVIPDFKSHGLIMSHRVIYMKTVKAVWCVCNVSVRWTVKTGKFTKFVYSNFLAFSSLYIYMQPKYKQTNSRLQQTKILQNTAFSIGFTMLNQRLFKKNISKSSTQFPFLLLHTVFTNNIFLVFLDVWTAT